MKINFIEYHKENQQGIKDLTHWEPSFDAEVSQTVSQIIHQIRERGDAALLDYTRQFDHNNAGDITQLCIAKKTLAKAWESLSDEKRHALAVAKARITHYAEKQKISAWQITESDGSMVGQQVSALDSVGLYVPGGTAAYPSSVLMNAIPAKVAGVGRLVMVSPAIGGVRNPMVLAAAFLCEVDEFYTIGGAQAIASLAYGTKSIGNVDKIVGPGNIFVATAKKQVFGKVAIDMIAGPSEIAVISDGSTDPHWVAADLFSQAEHDPNAQSILITHSKAHAEAVVKAMDALLEKMPRREIIAQSIANRGAVVLTQSVAQSVEVAELIAPEHLEILTENAEEIAPRIKHAGAIFVGRYSCEVLGDYVAGPNHVLPTSGTAKFSSPLGVYDFQKRTSIIACHKEKASTLAKQAKVLAESEGLYAHALSAQYRINDSSETGVKTTRK